MKHILFICLFATLFIACEDTSVNSNPTAENETDTSAVSPEPEVTEDPDKLPAGYTTIIATYKSCAVYAGATDYYFIKEDGEGLDFRISNTDGLSEEEITEMKSVNALEGFDIKLQEQMIDGSEDVEGPPGANPSFIDQKFQLIYNEKENLVEVKLAD
jgi:hypothetical protein